MVCVTHWDFSPRAVKISAGTTITGYRLRPGTIVDVTEFRNEIPDPSNIGPQIEGMIHHDHESMDIVEALGTLNETIESLARQQGVSSRTLQRHFSALSLPPPGFWRLLGRARRAVQALPAHVPLAEIALEYGYSDQAHMTREFMRWFGMTPAQLRQSPATLHDLSRPGLGNWPDKSRQGTTNL